MLKIFSLYCCFILPFLALSQEITLEDMWLKLKYYPNFGDQIDFQENSANYTRLITTEYGNQKLELYSIETGKRIETLFDGEKYPTFPIINSYRFSKDNTMLLLATNEETIYRYSTKANYFLYNIDRGELTALSNNGKQMYPKFSPDNKSIAFIRDNNIFYKQFGEDKETQVTFDGKKNEIINGHSDWVYEEEFKAKRMYEWSKDGKQILFVRFDEREVKEFTYMKYGSLYPEPVTFKYPKAGEKNAEVSLQLYTLENEQLSTLEIPYSYEYIPRIYATDIGFAFQLLNRHQNHLKLISFQSVNENFETVYEEKDDRYIEIPIVFDYLAGNNWIISSEKDDYTHLYTVINKNVNPITQGNFEVTDYYGIDNEGWVYYQSTEKSSVERHIYKKKVYADEKIALTEREGVHEGEFTGNKQFFIQKYSASDVPLQIAVKNNSGETVRVIENNSALKKQLKPIWNEKTFFEIPLQGYSLNAWMIKPKDFDKSKQYPLFMKVYGGPGDQEVINSWGYNDDAWAQMLAEKGYIVACVDNRGTGMKSSEFKKMTYLELGKYEVEDQIKAAQYLGQFPYIDSSRIGIYGWSYGGFMSALCLFKGKGVFKVALSVAPITNWRFYDTIYTERYMRTPNENQEGYDKNSPIYAVKEWEVGDLFLAQGMADDNVHFQNVVELVEAMNQSNKEYTLYLYPNNNHNIEGLRNRYHLYSKMTEFILKKL